MSPLSRAWQSSGPARRERMRWFRDLWVTHNPPERNPMVLFICLVVAVSVFPTAVGIKALPGSLANSPDTFGQLTAVTLELGSAACALGILWPNRDTGLAFELGGKLVLGFGSAFYCAALVLMTPGVNSSLAAGNAGGIAIGCFVRAVQIGLYVRNRYKDAQAHPEWLEE